MYQLQTQVSLRAMSAGVQSGPQQPGGYLEVFENRRHGHQQEMGSQQLWGENSKCCTEHTQTLRHTDFSLVGSLLPPEHTNTQDGPLRNP